MPRPDPKVGHARPQPPVPCVGTTNHPINPYEDAKINDASNSLAQLKNPRNSWEALVGLFHPSAVKLIAVGAAKEAHVAAEPLLSLLLCIKGDEEVIRGFV